MADTIRTRSGTNRGDLPVDQTRYHDNGDGSFDESIASHQYVWDGSQWVKATSSGGGGGSDTQYTEDAAAAANPIGTAVNLVRADTPATVTDTDGDNVAQRGTNYGAAYVTLLDTGGSAVSVGGGTQYTEDAAAAANPTGTQIISRRRDTLTGAEVSTDGDVIALNSTSKGELYVKQTDAVPVTDNGGNLSIDDGGNSITVDGTVGVFGTVTVDSELTTADLDTGAGTDTRAVVGLAGAASGGAVLVQATSGGALKGDVTTIAGTAPDVNSGNKGSGTLRVVLATDQPALTNALKVDASATTQPVSGTVTASNTAGDIANDGADSGNPVKVGGVARTAPTGVSTTGDRVNAMFDLYGKLIVRESLREDLGNQQTSINASTSETTIVTADATYKLDVYGLILTNTSATGTKVTIKDSTTGTTRFVFYVPPTETRGFQVSPSGAHKQAAANNNWTATCGTSVATLEVTAMTTRSL